MDNIVLLYIGLANLIVSIIVFIFLIFNNERSKGFLIFMFMILCPVVAPGFLVLSWCFRKLFYTKEIDMADLSFNTEKLEMIIGPEFEKEIDVVPVEEALLVSDNANKRRVILNVLKEDYNNSLTSITSALESDDSETSHYVATVIADVKSEFKATVQKMQEGLNKFPNDVELSCMIIDYIDAFLEKKVLSDIEEITYVEQYSELMEDLYSHNKEAITGKMYRQIINHLLMIKNSAQALRWGERAISQYPEELEVYKGILKLYYETYDREKFIDTLKKMKDSPIQFDNESIELVRFYQV